MKALILSSTILLCVILSTVLVALCSNKLLSDMYEDIESTVTVDDLEGAYGSIERIKADYEEKKSFFILFMRGKDTEGIEAYIDDVKSAIVANDDAGFITAKSRLLLHIEQLRRLSVFNLESIF